MSQRVYNEQYLHSTIKTPVSDLRGVLDDPEGFRDNHGPAQRPGLDQATHLFQDEPYFTMGIEQYDKAYVNEHVWAISRTASPAMSISSEVSSASFSTKRKNGFMQLCRVCGMTCASIGRIPLVNACGAPFRLLNAKITQWISNSRFHGWRMGVLFGATCSGTVLCLNTALLIILANTKNGFQEGFAEPFNYEPRKLSRLSTLIHVLINALSTVLLAASNYAMQVMSSPSRSDLDKAHASGTWYDVGLLSVRNLKHIPRRRLVICMILGLSSAPLHLFYNSAAIYIATTVRYDIHMIDWSSQEWNKINSSESYIQLSQENWKSTYDTELVHVGDLYFGVSEAAELIDDVLVPDTNWHTNTSWVKDIPGSRALIQRLSFNITADWLNLTSISDRTLPNYLNATQIFAERSTSRKEKIVFSLWLFVIVIVCNAVKLATLLFILFREKCDFVVTLGDCAASFLREPDPHTTKMCVFSKEQVVAAVAAPVKRRHSNQTAEKLDTEDPEIWQKEKRPYMTPLGTSRSIGEYFIVVVTCLSFLLCATIGATGIIKKLWGTTSDTILGRFEITSQNTTLIAWLVNTPQLILSFCYLSINSQCTTIAGVHEWNQLATSRKGLRVTKAQEDQRTTYFLQLPYRWSLPIAIMSGGFHWLLSQSIFLVRLDIYDHDGNLLDGSEGSRMGCGISGLSSVVLCASFWVLIVAVGSIGRRVFTARVPYAASCSLVVSAACHPPLDEPDTYLRKVQWGVLEERRFDGERHCCLSSGAVERPVPGARYL